MYERRLGRPNGDVILINALILAYSMPEPELQFTTILDLRYNIFF